MTRLDGLTLQQHRVALLIAQCWTVKQIAAELHISVQAVHDHIDAIALAWALDVTRDVRAQIVRRLAQRPAA